MHLDPAAYVVHVFGGVRATARALGKTPPTISRWQHPRREHLKGLVPSKYHREILEKAKALDLDISAHDLVHGREVV